MSEQQARAGGRVTESEIFINADQVTMFGNGTIDHPLHTAGSSAPTVEHLLIETDEGAASPTVNTTFVEADTESEVVNITLADGETDGFQKTIVFTGSGGPQWEITPANFADGVSIILSDFGSAKLVWNATAGSWSLLMMLNGTINP